MKLIVLLSRFPYPLEKGDKLRAYYQLKYLHKKHDIYCIALNDKKLSNNDIQSVAEFCKELHIINIKWWNKIFYLILFFLKGLPMQCGYFYSKKAQKTINKHIKRINPDHIYGQLIRVAEYIKHQNYKKTIDYQDALSKGMYRRYKKSPFYLKPFLYLEYKRLIKYEAHVFDLFDNHTIITKIDRDLINHKNSNKIHVVTNGVDFDTFKYNGEEKEFEIIFSGNMSYFPNVDAAEFLTNKIIPKLKNYFPNIKLVICGTNPNHRVKALANKNIIVTGWVDSTAKYYAKSKIFVAPMRFGSGLQNKILEAMAVGLPCVTSNLAGKPLENINSEKEIIICDTVSEYCDAIIHLLNDIDFYDKISKNGHEYVLKNYNWEYSSNQLDAIFNNNKI